MPKFNIDRIRQIVGEINVSLSKLKINAALQENEFLSSPEKIDSSKYNLIIAIEGAIDICNHIVAKIGGRSPCDYADCFGVLSELNILPDEFTERLKKMAKFRNLLVHLYWKVDDHKVYQIIKDNIQDIEIYLEKISNFIEE